MDRAFLLQFAPEAVMLLFIVLGAVAVLILMRPFLRWYLGLGRMEEALYRIDTRLEDLFLLLEEEDGREAAHGRAIYDFPEPPAVPPPPPRTAPAAHSRLRDLETAPPRPRAPEPHLSRVPDPPLARGPERPAPPVSAGGALRFRGAQARRPVIRKNT